MSDRGEFIYAFDFFGDYHDLNKLQTYVEQINRKNVTFWWEDGKLMQPCESISCQCQQSCCCYKNLKDWERLTLQNGLTVDPNQPPSFSHAFHLVVYDPLKGELLCMLSTTWELTPKSKRAPTKDEMIDMFQWNIARQAIIINNAIQQAQTNAKLNESMSRIWPPLAPRAQQTQIMQMV
jgi:hypothetical protein